MLTTILASIAMLACLIIIFVRAAHIVSEGDECTEAVVDEEDEHTHCSCAGCRGQCQSPHSGAPNCEWCCGKACSVVDPAPDSVGSVMFVTDLSQAPVGWKHFPEGDCVGLIAIRREV